MLQVLLRTLQHNKKSISLEYNFTLPTLHNSLYTADWQDIINSDTTI